MSWIKQLSSGRVKMKINLNENYDIYIKLLTIIYISYDLITYNYKIRYGLIFILIMIIATFGIHLINDKFKKYILVIQIIISVYFSINFMKSSVLFLFISLVDLLIEFNVPLILNLVIIILISYVFKENLSFMKSVMITISYLCYKKNYKSLTSSNSNLKLEDENKRKYIKELNDKINKEIKYRNQALYTKDLEIRNELAGKVHDRVGHTIAGSIMQLEACKIVLNSGDKEKTCNMINNTIGVLRSGMNEIRKTLREIRPLDEQIGINKVKLLLEEKVQDTGFNFSLDYKGDMEKIDKEQWMFILDFIMETSTNTLKYSKGNHIGVKIEAFNKMCKTQISDNGVGCKYIKKGIGLKSIEENALKLGGNILINSNEGFEVILLIPFKNY